MKNLRLILLIQLLLLISGVVRAAVTPADLEKANRAYTAGSYQAAADLYLKLTEAGYGSPVLYYNLGNAYFKMNDFARAILWYERARKLDPSSEDIDFNLNVANTRIADKIEPIPVFFLKKWLAGLVWLFSADTWAMAGIIALVAALAGFVLYQVSRVLFLRKAGFWGGTGLLTVSLLMLILAWSSHRIERSTSEAIVFAPTITVTSSPNEQSTDLFVLHEGTKVRLLDQISGWYEVRIANGSVGWLPVEALEKI